MRDFKELIGLKKELIDYLNRYEINVVCIPIFKNSKKIIKQCDGVILPGGNEINNDDIKIIGSFSKGVIIKFEVKVKFNSIRISFWLRQV